MFPSITYYVVDSGTYYQHLVIDNFIPCLTHQQFESLSKDEIEKM